MESRTRFLSLVPLVHSRVRGHTIRGIRSKDIHSIKQLNVPLYRHTDKSVYVKDGLMDRWLGSTFAKSFYLQFLYDNASVCVVAENTDGVILGCGTAKVVRRPDGSNGLEREGHILTLAVDPAWRRRGIGRDLLEALVLQIRTVCARLSTQMGQRVLLKSVVLQTSARNAAALKFYEGCGYQRQGLKAGYYGGGKDAIPMMLSLPEIAAVKSVKEEEIAGSTSGRNWVAVY